MQVDPTRVPTSTPAAPATPGTPTSALRGPVTDALRAVEAFLLRGGGQQTARRNAWRAVCEDRRRARDRKETLTVLDSFWAARPPGPR